MTNERELGWDDEIEKDGGGSLPFLQVIIISRLQNLNADVLHRVQLQNYRLVMKRN